jgi:hypothetical protein
VAIATGAARTASFLRIGAPVLAALCVPRAPRSDFVALGLFVMIGFMYFTRYAAVDRTAPRPMLALKNALSAARSCLLVLDLAIAMSCTLHVSSNSLTEGRLGFDTDCWNLPSDQYGPQKLLRKILIDYTKCFKAGT